MLDRYEIQSKPTEDTASVDENGHLEDGSVDVAAKSKACSPDLLEQPVGPSAQEQDSKRFCVQVVRFLQYTGSLLLLLFSAVLVLATVVTRQTMVAESTHPIVAITLLVGLLLWLGVLEGGQGCIVALQSQQLGVDSQQQRPHASSHRGRFGAPKPRPVSIWTGILSAVNF